jgi:hypothetical protein
MIRGDYRTKRRNPDFMSEDEDDEGGLKRRKLGKKMRRQLKLDKKNGVELIGTSVSQLYLFSLTIDIASTTY